MQSLHQSNGNVVNSFTTTASVVQYIPYLGQPTAMLLQAVGLLVHENAECKKICGELPENLRHFSVKINHARSCTNGQNNGEAMLKKYAVQFDELIQRVKGDLDAYHAVAGKRVGWFAASKYKGKFNKHVQDLVAINGRLDDAIKQVTMEYVKHVVDRLDGFGLPAGSPQGSVAPSQDAKLVGEALESARLLMAEVDIDHDGFITIDELWNVQQLQALVADKGSLAKLVNNVFDRDGDGKLNYEETITLAAALHQLSKLFYSIPHRCQDPNYITGETAVQALKRVGYNSIGDYDILEAAQLKPECFKQCEDTRELHASYEGFLAFYLHALDRHNLWAHARSRIGAA